MSTTVKKLRSMRNPLTSKRVQVKFNLPSLTQQSDAADADINNIMARYQSHAIQNHAEMHAQNYGFKSAQSLKEALDMTQQSQSIFADLPSSERAKFDNKVTNFFEFIQNPANEAEALARGYKTKTDAPASTKAVFTATESPAAISTENEHSE